MSSSRYDAFIAALPNGLDSYPRAELKASVMHVFLGDYKKTLASPAAAASLAPPLRAFADKLPPESAWVREVHATALFMWLIDHELGSDDAFTDLAYRKNKELLDGIAYRILFRMLRAKTVINGAASRWEMFHRNGVKLVLAGLEDQSASIRLEYPAHLVPAVMAGAYTTAFRAAVELTGARDVEVNVTDRTPERATFHCTWR